MAPLKLIFAGTPDFSVPTLKALIDAGHHIKAVYTQPDRPAGRGRKLTASPVKEAATRAGVQVLQPASLRDDEAVRRLRAQQADLMVVVAYGLLLPRAVLDAPRLGCVNVHASLLPRWRGAAPIQRCILNGDSRSGVTIMRMEAGLDTGPTYLKRGLDLAPTETGGSLHDRLSGLGARALLEALPEIAEGGSKPEPQDDTRATYAKKITKEEALVDWTQSAVEIERMVRAFNPWPVAQTRHRDGNLRLWESELAGESPAGEDPGRVIGASKSGIEVATGRGVLQITRLQLPGKRPMSAAEFLNAHRVEGETFG